MWRRKNITASDPAEEWEWVKTGTYGSSVIREEKVSEIHDLKMRIQALEASVFPEDIVTPSIRAEIRIAELQAELAELRADNADLLMCDADVAELQIELTKVRSLNDVWRGENTMLQADLADTNEALEHVEESRDYWRSQAKAVPDKRVTKALLQSQEANRELCKEIARLKEEVIATRPDKAIADALEAAEGLEQEETR